MKKDSTILTTSNGIMPGGNGGIGGPCRSTMAISIGYDLQNQNEQCLRPNVDHDDEP
jgi:hypothetical protein